MTDHAAQLLPGAFAPLPLGAIRPAGWLLAQLRTQADGLGGHLDEIWPDVADSAWIGGMADGWERGPYWLDGFVPLAFLLNDDALIERARRWVDAILERQQPDGWLGPVRDESMARRHAYDPWPVFVALKALSQFQSATDDPRIVPAMLRFMRNLDHLLDRQPLFDWGRYRWSDLALSVYWLYERTDEGWLLDLAAKSYRQSFDWRAHFERFPYHEKQERDQIHPSEPPEPGTTFCTDLASHVVNNAMAIKQPAVWWRLSGTAADSDAAPEIIATLDRFHGQATGVFTGDEHLAGLSPSQGTELCAVVEYMFSLETLIAILGDARLVDRLEQIAYNALPASFAPDMWTHQYVQQANQAVCAVCEDRVYTNNGPDANIFGLEPHFGCCTANYHQGWPKLASSLWMHSDDGGLAAVAYAPCDVATDVAGQPVNITVATNYPFNDAIRITVENAAPTRFPLHLHVPGWAEHATLSIDDAPPVGARAGRFHVIDREWSGRSELVLRLPMRMAIEPRPLGGVAITRGPLVFALQVDAEWRPIPPVTRSAPVLDPRLTCDYELHPVTDWNYALALDSDDPDLSITFERRSVGPRPFSPDDAPVLARVKGRRLPSWTLEHGAAAPVPVGPVNSDEPLEELMLVPYGCTNLRITEFPVLAS